MKKVLQFGTTILLLVLGFAIYQYLLPELRPPRGFLKVETTPSAEIILGGESLGDSPLQKKNLKVGHYELIIKAKVQTRPEDSSAKPGTKSIEMKQEIDLDSSAVTAVKYELAPHKAFHSGEVLGLRNGTGLSVITKPENAEVLLDGESLGAAPISQVIDPGIHTLKVSKEGYISREIGVNIEKGFRLTASVTLALNPNPYPQTKQISEKGKFTLYDLSTNNSNLNSDFKVWVEAIWYFQNVKKNSPKKFDILVDENGKSYTLVPDYSKKKEISVGYLSSSGGKLSPKAKKEWDKLVGGGSAKSASSQVKILDTPNGFLNVRSGPGTNHPIIQKINPGESFELIKEEKDWYKILLESTKEDLSDEASAKTGWISSQYAKKL